MERYNLLYKKQVTQFVYFNMCYILETMNEIIGRFHSAEREEFYVEFGMTT